MKFGRYIGSDLEELPGDYLKWLSTIELREPLRGAVFSELEARGLLPERTSGGLDLGEVKKAYRTVSMKWHPDREGGSTEAMKAINEFYSMLTGRG